PLSTLALHDALPISMERIRPFVERARRFSGWSLDPFAPRSIEPAEPWSYTGRAAELLQGAKDVLDLGTGGGEVFETLCSSFTGRDRKSTRLNSSHLV